MTQAAVGKGLRVSAMLGYLLTDYNMSVSGTSSFSVSKDAVAKAQAVWDSCLKSAAWPASGQGVVHGVYPARVSDSAYYYALEFIAEEYIRLRIGNVGLLTNGLVEKIMAKAQALLALAKDGIAKYEQWCNQEAGIIGANTIELLDNLVEASFDGSEEAYVRWTSTVSDYDSDLNKIYRLDVQFQDRIRQAAYGFSLRILGIEMNQRKLGFSGARSPAIAQFYTQQAGTLVSLGDKLIAEYMQWLTETKQVLYTVKNYKKRDNAYGVMTIVADTIPSSTDSLFRIRSLVTAGAVTLDNDTQEMFLVLHSGFGNTLHLYWYSSLDGTYGFKIKTVTTDGILAPDMDVIPKVPGAGIHRAELVVFDIATGEKTNVYNIYVNIEWPLYESRYGAVTLRNLRASIGSLLPTSVNTEKLGQLEFDDALLCEAAFLACEDWNTRMTDFKRKVTPAMFKELSLFKQGILAHAVQLKGIALSLSQMGVADTKAPNVHAFEQSKANTFTQLGDTLLKRYIDDVIRCQRRVWNHAYLR